MHIIPSIANIGSRHILNEMLLAVASRPPQEPRNNICLDSMPEPACVGDSANHIFRFFKRNLDALSPELLVGVKGFLHGVRLALFDPARDAAGEEDGVFEDDACAFTLGRHGVLKS